MSAPHPNQKLLRKIKGAIKKENPHSRLYGRTLFFGKLAAVGLLFAGSSMAMSMFIADAIEKLSIIQFMNGSLVAHLANILFELLLVSLAGIIGMYLIYRHTDWPFVKERFGLVVLSFTIITLCSAGIVTFLRGDPDLLGDMLRTVRRSVEYVIPFRSHLRERMESDLERDYYFTGKIIAISGDPASLLISVRGTADTKNFLLRDHGERLSLGDDVILRYESEKGGDSLWVERIKKI